jgi:hypothetical protein
MMYRDGPAPFLTQSRAHSSLRRELDAIRAELTVHLHSLSDLVTETTPDPPDTRRHQRASAADPSVGLTVLPNRVIARLGAVGVSFSWVPGRTDMVEDGRLLVIEWRGVVGAQRGNGTFTSGTPGWQRIYRAEASDPADWRWRDEEVNGLACTTAMLVEECISNARTETGGPKRV